ncbi:GntR family transcriptional regulator [Alteromonas sp. a30]|uniref:GntR family transcriptional regulator n=1 Tax=Alteromonas sp. a30 TaxID=2730917 RepID=UPI00228181DD|nr:GntR family transcriptional regulator [Alteromonas sp. a30]MCY7294227.1 GntR family transcriptional regulator [Alteromonas sp. a30]
MGQIQTRKLAEVIAEQLETMLIEGKLLPGQRLPSERDLAAQFEVSRPSLREAIQTLVSKGLLMRKQGGGTYVANQLTPKVTDPLMELVATRPEGQFDLLEFRHALEGMAAYYAALRGTQSDYKHLNTALERVQKQVQKDDLSALAQALAEFYMCMAKGSHNMVLIHVMGNLSTLLKENIEGNLRLLQTAPEACKKIHQQREEIAAAIVARNPSQARNASNEHLAYIEQTLLEINQKDSRMQRALRRIEINQG